MRDRSGIPDSCPFIDEAIKTLEDSIKRLDRIIESNENEDDVAELTQIAWSLTLICDGKKSPLEKARGIHSDLRQWGNEKLDERIEIESELAELQNQKEK